MRKFNVTVNGKAYEVEVEEVGGSAASSTPAPVVNAAPAPAPAAAPSGKGTAVNAPMPGLVLKLAVANGTAVKRGDKIVVLEAMKMENDITAPVDGVITYAVKQGDSVETGALFANIG